jgi:hypothetical protein
VVKVLVSDGLTRALPGAKVSFRLASGAGTLSASEALTDEDGTASTTLTLGSTPGPVRVWAAIDGLFARMFSATVLAK